MNVLNLISQRLDTIYQIKPKHATVLFLPLFRDLNTAFHGRRRLMISEQRMTNSNAMKEVRNMCFLILIFLLEFGTLSPYVVQNITSHGPPVSTSHGPTRQPCT
jgi:hypothetical protein